MPDWSQGGEWSQGVWVVFEQQEAPVCDRGRQKSLENEFMAWAVLMFGGPYRLQEGRSKNDCPNHPWHVLRRCLGHSGLRSAE